MQQHQTHNHAKADEATRNSTSPSAVSQHSKTVTPPADRKHIPVLLYAVLVAIVLGGAYWLLDATLDAYVFNLHELSFTQLAFTDIPTHELHVRLGFATTCLLAGYVTGLTIRSQRTTQHMLSQSQNYARSLIDHISDGFFVLDNDMVIQAFNPAAGRLLGVRSEQVTGKRIFDEVFTEAKGSLFEARYRHALEHRQEISFEAYFDQEPYQNWYEVRVCPIDDGIAVMFQVTTERRRDRMRIEHLNDILRAIRNVNQLICREQHKDRLIRKACALLTETRGYTSAWIITTDLDGRIDDSAQSGLDNSFDFFRRQIDENSLPHCGRLANQAGKVVCIRDPAEECKDCCLIRSTNHEQAMSTPLIYGDKQFGLLTASVAKAHQIDQDEMELFEEVAGDLALALHNLIVAKQQADTTVALRQSAERFRLVTQATRDAIWDWDLVNNVIWRNEHSYTYYGNGVQTGKTLDWWTERIHPDDRKRILGIIEQTIAGVDKNWTCEYRLRTADDTYAMVSERGYVLRNTAGQALRAVSAVTDITSRRQDEQALEFQATVLDQIGDLITVTDLDGMITYVNAAVAAKFNTDKKSLIGQHVATYGDDSTRGATQQKIVEQTIADGQWQGEVVNIAPDGSETILDCRTWLFRDANGNPVGLCGVSSDITKRKQIEAALQDSEQQYRLIVETAGEGIWILDNQARITFVNQRMIDMLGYPHEDMLNRPLFDFIDPHDHAQAREYLTRLDQKASQQYDLRFIRNDGAQIWTNISATAITDESGDITARLGMITDISDRKTAEQQLATLNRQLEDKNAELESIVYVASHDLRSPLVNLKGFSNQLQRDCIKLIDLLKNQQPSEQDKVSAQAILNNRLPDSINFIDAAVGKMDGLINGLLRLSRVGKADMRIEHIDMNTLARRVCEALRYQTDQIGAQIRIDNLPACRGDATQINQVLTNLLDNAVKYRHPERDLHIHVRAETSDNMIIYSVQDNGIGIPPDAHGRVFDLFSRLNPAGPITGDGLGLTTVKRIVARHEGKVWLESDTDNGSCFFFALPAAV